MDLPFITAWLDDLLDPKSFNDYCVNGEDIYFDLITGQHLSSNGLFVLHGGDIYSVADTFSFYSTEYRGHGLTMMNLLPSVQCSKDPAVYTKSQVRIGSGDGCTNQPIICAYDIDEDLFYKFVFIWDSNYYYNLMYWMPDYTN